MTDHAAREPEPYAVTDEQASPIDHYLDFFQGMLDREDGAESDPPVGLPLVVSVGGLVISGQCISHEEWIGEIASKLGNEQASGSLKTFWLKDLDEAKRDDEDRRSKGLNVFAKRFIHLQDATIWSGNQRINVGVWRGRLDHLDGWTIGGLSE